MKARPVKTTTKKLVQKFGAGGLAARVGVTEATIKRWLSVGPPAARHDAIQAILDRSESARRGWETRRLHNAREIIFKQHGIVSPSGEPLTGHRPETHTFLTAMLRENDPAWVEFREHAERQGMGTQWAKNQWYSPGVGGKPGAKKKSKKPRGGKKRNKGRKKSRKGRKK
jgi:hypothetical protein